MSDEFEVAGMASVGALADKAPVSEAEEAASKSACANCHQPLTGQFCKACGQLGSDFHRPVWTLVKDVLSDALSLDGRIARTLPRLMLAPGKVTRAYLEGKRARYVPPFRLFLLSSLVFFFTLFSMGDRVGWADGLYIIPQPGGGYEVTIGGSLDVLGGESAENISALTPQEIRAILEKQVASEPGADDEADEFINIAVKAFENQRAITLGIERWAPRLSFLMLPLMALFLTLAYTWVRRIYVYDHLITSLHFQSFAYLLGAFIMLAGLVVGGPAAWALLLLPIYLYRQLRETYQSGRITSGIRAFVLFILLITCLVGVSVGASVLGFMDLS